MPEPVAKICRALAVLMIGSVVSLQADFFVSPTGADSNPGTETRPFASLERARDAVREQEKRGPLNARTRTVWLRGGDYLRLHALELNPEDSGTPDFPIIWRASRGERVRLTGGRPLRGFQPVTDPAVLNRLDEKARTQVLALIQDHPHCAILFTGNRLRPESPAWKLGFQAIPMEKIGLQTNADRQELERLSHTLSQ